MVPEDVRSLAHDAPLLKTRRRFNTNSVENIDPLEVLSWGVVPKQGFQESEPCFLGTFPPEGFQYSGEHTGAEIKIKVSQRLPMFSLLGVVVFDMFDAMAARVPLCVFAKPPRPNP